MEHIVLASGSKQRAEYLKLLGLPFSCVPSGIDEAIDTGMDLADAVEDLARRKVMQVAETLKNENPLWITGADTVIALDGKTYGKPQDRKDAKSMLKALQGREHKVITGMALYNGRKKTLASKSVISSVSIAEMEAREIDWYLDSGEWKDAAGAYRIQGLASCFISEIQGSFSSIAGLPLREFYVMLQDNGYPYGG